MTTELTNLIISLLYMVLTSVLATFARKLVKKTIENEFVQELFNEAIASAELCACCFELIIVADNYGVSSYAICLFILTIWWANQWENATACPYTHLEDVVNGTTTLRVAIFKIWAQLTGGCLVFRYIQLLWSLELASTHAGRAYEDCTADLQVPMIFGAIVECVATCLCRLGSNVISDNLSNTKVAVVLDSFVGTSLVVAAFNYSGGYFNPVLATALKYGCAGNTFTEHMVVYWFGAIAGSIASIYIYQSSIVKKLLGQKSKIE